MNPCAKPAKNYWVRAAVGHPALSGLDALDRYFQGRPPLLKRALTARAYAGPGFLRDTHRAENWLVRHGDKGERVEHFLEWQRIREPDEHLERLLVELVGISAEKLADLRGISPKERGDFREELLRLDALDQAEGTRFISMVKLGEGSTKAKHERMLTAEGLPTTSPASDLRLEASVYAELVLEKAVDRYIAQAEQEDLVAKGRALQAALADHWRELEEAVLRKRPSGRLMTEALVNYWSQVRGGLGTILRRLYERATPHLLPNYDYWLLWPEEHDFWPVLKKSGASSEQAAAFLTWLRANRLGALTTFSSYVGGKIGAKLAQRLEQKVAASVLS